MVTMAMVDEARERVRIALEMRRAGSRFAPGDTDGRYDIDVYIREHRAEVERLLGECHAARSRRRPTLRDVVRAQDDAAYAVWEARQRLAFDIEIPPEERQALLARIEEWKRDPNAVLMRAAESINRGDLVTADGRSAAGPLEVHGARPGAIREG
jgi:hypothetical protein